MGENVPTTCGPPHSNPLPERGARGQSCATTTLMATLAPRGVSRPEGGEEPLGAGA